jgi:putative aminopeptidase FrvX
VEHAARQLLTDLVNAPSPVGHEAAAVRVWLDYAAQFADETFTDAWGNGFAVLNPEGDPCVMLDGHADEIGLMVTHIDDEGFLWVGRLGGYDAKVLPSMRVRVLAKKGPLPGVVGALPPHMQGPDGTVIEVYKYGEHVYVDIGAADKKQAERYVRVGDPIVPDYGLMELNGELAVGRGLDNKIGIWAAIEALRLAGEERGKLNAKVVAVAAVQEEIGCYGAGMAAFRLEPDVAIAIDVTQAVDHPGTEKKRFGDCKLGKGPALAHGSACHPAVVERLYETAKHLRIDVQHEAAANGTGTDADSIYITRAGIPTAVLSLPQRYMHSPAEMVNLKDLEQLSRILGAFCLGLKRGERFTVAV